MKINYIFLLILAVLLPNIVVAELRITEIMYDIDGTDTGREWIEIFNGGAEEVDLSDYKLLENSVNHKISAPDDGLTILPANSYAVIADNVPKFITDNVGYDGLIFDSAFSLNNSGENLALIDSEGNVVHSVNYSPEWGAKGTGNTLQLKIGSDDWIPAAKTPGSANSENPADESIESESRTENDSGSGSGGDSGSNSSSIQSNSSTNTSNSAHSGQNELSDYSEKTSLEIGSGRTRFGIINSPIQFKAISNQDKNSKIKYEWSFGDATSERNTNVDHAYYHAGTYNVVLNGEYMDEQATSRTKIHIREPIVDISLISRGETVDIMLKNDSDFEVNFGGFFFELEDILGENFSQSEPDQKRNRKQQKQKFIIPKDTILDPKSQIIIAGEISGFGLGNITMYYPNGKFADNFVLFGAEEIDKIKEIINVFTL